MASQLREVLNHFENQATPVSLHQMAQNIGIERGVLDGMIAYWVRKGKLREVNGTGEACHTCGIKGACPFVIAMPRYYELVRDGDDANAPSACDCGGTCHS